MEIVGLVLTEPEAVLSAVEVEVDVVLGEKMREEQVAQEVGRVQKVAELTGKDVTEIYEGGRGVG